MVQQQLENQEALEKLTELVNEVKICMFATVKDDYTVFSRPMQTIHVDNEGSLWFFTNEHAGKVEDLSKDNKVFLMYSHPGKNTYLHVNGTCTVVDDKDKIKELWSPAIEAWFPKGIDDPELALLKVDANEASYWDNSSNKLVVFYNMVKAIAKGEKADEGKFGKLSIN